MRGDVAFASFFMAGFESASQRRRDGVRLDLIRATRHDRHAAADYRLCASLGLLTVRDALRWHRIETAPGRYDWDSWVPMLEASAEAGVQPVWTLYHYGSPDHRDQTSPDFVNAFADFAAEAVRVHRRVIGGPPLICPINEISFFAWAVGKGYFPLSRPSSAAAFKQQLVRCGLAAVEAMKATDSECRFIWSEPMIHVAARDTSATECRRAEGYRIAQFEAYDMLTGRLQPELGGRTEVIDVAGFNFYPHNQWYCQGATIPLGHHAYRPLRDMLMEASRRYQCPIAMTETGAEGSARPAWLHYVCDEIRAAMAEGADVRGICLYPITHYPGWDNSRLAEVGAFSEPAEGGQRAVFQPLVDELERQKRSLSAVGAGRSDKPVSRR